MIDLRWGLVQILGRQLGLRHRVELGFPILKGRLEWQAHLDLGLVLGGFALGGLELLREIAAPGQGVGAGSATSFICSQT